MKIPSQISSLLMEANRREEYTSHIKYLNLIFITTVTLYYISSKHTKYYKSRLYINIYTNINQPRINIQLFTITIYF